MNRYRIELKWAVIFTLMMLGWLFLERLAGLHDVYLAYHPTYTNLVAIPAAIVYVLALRDKREHYYGGEMSYRQGFTAGVVMTVMVAVLSPLAQLITHTIVTPDYFTNVIRYSVEQGYLTQAEAEANFNLSSYVFQAFIGSLVLGLLTAAIVAFFVRRRGT
ncbi:hypothetical protein GGR26_001616 [Lewinella marina]|uniref:DUF4199 domain-containing protein n=1 Tax=Neolewinella marina TaxID=438751 RepID=A0A2G0CAY7_9BACT|nr:DUF4199 domain-containing protein [Neolewinella marina]NJB85848.1 hypothetical protein [Neolewinella marina]PHK97087.1 DUF4199 domain-containing protein [Neolewinella marina]